MGTQTKRGRPRKGPDPERSREILDAAAEAILTRGYDATSMQEIADAVELLKGSLYYYVNSKEDFLYQIIQPVYEAALEAVYHLMSSDDNALNRLVRFVHAHVAFVAANLRAFRIRLREFSQLSPERRVELSKSGDEYYRVLRSILAAGIEEGLVDPQIDVRLTTLSIVGQLNSVAQWYDPNGKYSANELGHHLAGQIVAAVASDAAVSERGGIEQLRQVGWVTLQPY